jgi:hypothetical protein
MLTRASCARLKKRSRVDRDATRLRLAAKQSRRPSSILASPTFNYPPRRANLTRRIHQDLEKIRADFRKIFQILRAFPDFAQKSRCGILRLASFGPVVHCGDVR